jgi:tetratricopeptide (TPR) repeat protein
VECYWEDGREGSREGWEKLVAVAASHPDVMQSVEYKLARGLTDKLTMAVATDLLQMLGDRLGGEETRAELISSSAWTAAVRALVEAVLKLETTVAAEWARVAQLTTKLADAGLSISPAARAMLHFRAQELGRAVELWNQGQPNDRNSHEYRVAKAYSAQYPDKLTALSDLGKFDDVIAAYDANPTVKLSRDQAHAVGRAFSARGNYEGALPHLVEAYDGQGLADIVVGAYAGQSELALRATIALFAVTAANARWTDMLPYLEGKSLPVVRRTADGLRAWMSRNQRHLDLELMRTLARSESLGDIKWDARGELLKLRTFAEYLKKRLFTNERPNVGAANLAELGAAVERTGDRVYALQYYEKLSADESLNADLRQQARERWVICKERQARFMEKDGDTKRATKAYAEARDRRKTLGMKPDDRILEYPEISSLANYLTAVLSMPLEQSQPQLPPPASAPEPMAPQPAITEERSTAIHSLEGGIVPAKDHANESASPTSVTDAPNTPTEPQRGNICGCVFEFFRQDGRLNINGENGITLAIRLPKKTCASADLTVTADGENSKRFTVEEWNLVVDLTHNEAVVLEFVDEQLELRFKLD